MRLWMVLSLAIPLAAATPETAGLNRFAGKLYGELAREPGNVLFSPLSVATALGMTLAGARGETARQMTVVLGAPPAAALLDTIARAGNSGGDQLLLAQSLWVERAFPLLGDFVRTEQEQFHAPPRTADFSRSPEAAREAINRWVAENTRDKIPTLFAPGTIGRDTRLVLASAVYFNGKWRLRFDPQATAQATFHTTPSSSLETPFMNQTAHFPYAETASAQVLELPYAGGSLAFDVILPKTGVKLSTLEEALRADGISAWVGNLERREVVVSLPRFRAESSYSLREALSALGMGDAFTAAADFSGIAGRRDLYLSQVAHKAFIDVSEEGTEAAAATGAVVTLAMARMQPTVFRADHPFLFFIRDTASGAVLFAGRLERPERGR